MEYDVRPHEPFDPTISGIFIVLILPMTLIIFAVV
jgi:hypothetical protein